MYDMIVVSSGSASVVGILENKKSQSEYALNQPIADGAAI